MSYNNIQNEEVIDLKKLCFFILRKWRMLLIAAVIGAVLFGGYKTVSYLTAAPEPVLTQEEIEETQAQIVSNETTISNDQSTIPVKQAKLDELRVLKATYEESLSIAMSIEKVDSALVSDILELNNNIADVDSQIASVSQTITNLNHEITSLTETNDELNAKLNETAVSKSWKSVANGVLIGAFLGLVIVCAYMAFLWVFGGKLQDVDAFALQYHMPVIGSVHEGTESDSAKPQGVIDRWIDRLAGSQAVVDSEQEYQILAAKIRLLAKEDCKILFTGTVEKDKLVKVYEGVKAHFLEEEYDLLVAENPMYHSEIMQQMHDSKLVLVEAAGLSKKKEITQLVEFLNVANIPVVGVVSVLV